MIAGYRAISHTMAAESTSDAIRRLRLEARTIVDEIAAALKNAEGRVVSLRAQLALLDDLSAELRRIAARAATPEMKRDAESLAVLVDETRRDLGSLSE